MIIGLRKFGKTNTLNNQFIKTVFFIIVIPLVPVHSVFHVNESSQIDIGLNLKSMFKTYFSWLTLLISFIFLFGSNFSNIFPVDPLTSLLIGGVSISLSVYFFFYFGNTLSEKDIELRNLYEKAIGINALPDYFSLNEAENFQKELLMTFKDKYGIKDWKEFIRNNEYNVEHLSLLFVISGFQNRLQHSKFSEELYIKLKEEFNKTIQ